MDNVSVVLLVLGCVIVAVGVLFAFALYRAFHPKPRGPGDPGNSRLHQLASDPIFHGLPPNAHSPNLTLKPAQWRETPFQGAGAVWDGPTVILTFKSSAPRSSVFEHYRAEAAEASWNPTNIGPLGLPVTWQKTYRDGVSASLVLTRLGPPDPLPGLVEYRLAGGTSPYSSH
jgi:hypothetical protein